MIRAAFIVLLILLTIQFGYSHSIEENSTLVSDGMHQRSQSSVLELDLTTTNVTCEPIYGFLPCTTTLWGELFMLVVYEFLLSLAGQYVSKGSELFFEMVGTGIFGASLFQMLALIPQLILVIVSAFSSSETTLESSASVGMCLLAGSVVMTLTVSWGSIIAFGSYNLSETSASSNAENTESFSLTGYGVTTDVETKITARIMLLSMIPFLLLQLAKILSSSSAQRVVVLISLIISLLFLISYCTYQVFKPWIQNRRFEYLMIKYIRKDLLHFLLTANGKPNESAIKQLFSKIDKDSDGFVSTAELRSFILGIKTGGVGLDEDDFVEKVLEEFDMSDDSKINETEFVKGLLTWLDKGANISVNKKKLSSSNSKKTTDEEQQSLVDGKTTKKSTTTKSDDKPWWNYTEATFLVIVGTGITMVLGQPLMETLYDFSASANISSFAVSYVVVPLALSYKQTLNVITSAKKKTENAISLTFSQTYGGVFMNNVMGLSTFLLLVCIRDLTWDVSAEVLVVLIICTTMGLIASFSTKFPFWISIIAYLMYPISLLLIYLLTSVLGWS